MKMVRICVGLIFIIREITLLTGIVIKSTSESPIQTLLTNFDLSKHSNSDLKNILRSTSYELDRFENKYYQNSLQYLNPVKIQSAPIATTNTLHQISNISKNVSRRNLLSDSLSQLPDIVKPIYEVNYEVDFNSPLMNKFSGYVYKQPSFDKTSLFKDEIKDIPTSYSAQELSKAVLTLDRFLKPLLNDGSYNSAVHPPTNPVLALILSRYGKYISGSLNPSLYSYMAVNNIHNNKPFGQYKYEYNDDNI